MWKTFQVIEQLGLVATFYYVVPAMSIAAILRTVIETPTCDIPHRANFMNFFKHQKPYGGTNGQSVGRRGNTLFIRWDFNF